MSDVRVTAALRCIEVALRALRPQGADVEAQMRLLAVLLDELEADEREQLRRAC